MYSGGADRRDGFCQFVGRAAAPLGRNTARNMLLTSGWMNNSWPKKAKGRLRQTSLSQEARKERTLNPA